MDELEEVHLQAAKQILKYLKGTLDFGLHLACNGDEIYFTFINHRLGMKFEH
jgi:hypothetical protein